MSGLHGDPSVSRPTPSGDVGDLFGAPRSLGAPRPGVETTGPAVLEVAQLWQEAVVEVRHLAPPRAETGRTALTAGSATGFRWRLLGMPLGWVGPRLARVAWLAAPTLSEVQSEARADLFAPAEHLPDALHDLFVWEEGCFWAVLSDRWTGWRESGGERVPLQVVLAEGRPVRAGLVAIPVAPGDQLLVEVGPVRFLARLAPPGARIAGRLREEIDLPFVGIMSSATMLAGLLGVAIATSPPPTSEVVVDIPDRITEVMLAIPPPPPPRKETVRATEPDAGAGKRAIREEGTTGRERGKRTARGDRFDQQRLDRELAEEAGLLGALADAGELGGVFAGGLDNELTAGIGSLHGAVGVQLGTGYGDRGAGPGGGGNEIGSFHGTGTHGRSDGTSGDFSGGGDLGPRRTGSLRTDGDPIVLGALDRSLIDAVVKRHMNQIRFCYQKELSRQPDLGGKVVVQFVISKSGDVSSAKIKSSSLGNNAVESCMTSRFLRFSFPEPAGGGIVIVSYPFMFSPG